ncbi:hypothetical protein BCR34DRAFT_578428, partial [Clohesyomyces aquaticus]
MAQGLLKKSTGPKSKPSSKPNTKTPRGNRVFKPKKASLISQNQIKKKSAAGLVGKT